MAKFTCNFISYVLMRTVDITVVIPSTTIPESMEMKMNKNEDHRHRLVDKFPVIYLLHGMGNNHATWTGYTNVEMFAEERQIAIVNISAENKSYVNLGGDDFYRFVSEEVPEFIKEMFPVSERAEDTYIAGLSMGGFGTLIHALGNPDKYAAFGIFSAAVDLNPSSLLEIGDTDNSTLFEGNINPQYVPEILADNIIKMGKKFPKIYMACGGQDFLLKKNIEFCKKLTDLGADVTWDEIEKYGHEWRFWNIEIEKFMDWLPRTDNYYIQGKRQI